MPGWWNRIGLKAQFMMITALNVAVTAVGVVIIVGWFQSQQIEEKLHSFSVNELQSLHALVISAMNRRPGDTQNVAIGVFNDWFRGRNTDYPGKLWSVWGTKTTAYMRTQDHARPPKRPTDAIDEEALRTGKPVGRFVNGAYRYSLPIVFGVTAGADGKNCVMCHGQLMGEKKGGVIAVFSSSLSTSADFAAFAALSSAAVGLCDSSGDGDDGSHLGRVRAAGKPATHHGDRGHDSACPGQETASSKGRGNQISVTYNKGVRSSIA